MRAFLSHSSSDKGYVQIVKENLRPGNYEFDSQTFDEGGLISGLLKDYDAKVKPGQLDRLVEISDQHPYNIYRMADLISS